MTRHGLSRSSDALASLADKRAEEYFARIRKEKDERFNAAIVAFGLTPSREYAADDPAFAAIDDFFEMIHRESLAAIDDFFAEIGRVLSDDDSCGEASPKPPSPPK
jgi:hypothetical protein